MEPTDLSIPDPTTQSRRRFMQATGGASVAAILGATTETATAVTDDGEFETNPFTLGVASGDPLPDAVVIWTRLAPNPLAADGAMPDGQFDVEWTLAVDEQMDDVRASGTATAHPAHAHAVHVDVTGLDPNTEYYYQFSVRGETSPTGRTKTAPSPDSDVEEFRFGFASCQRWADGYYTAYRYMAEDELDLIIHLGDYIYEYGLKGTETPRDRELPQEYSRETTNLDRYRLRYGLYKSDPDLRAAHASAPWLVTRDDHEVDNNWAAHVPQDPDEQRTASFIERRAAAFKAYYEHMPFRLEQRPDEAHQKLYRYFSFGDLVDFNVLDTRMYRSDQACDDVFDKVNCEERFEEDRTILGAKQRDWLLENLANSSATWNVVANQLPFAKMDFKRGPREGYRTEQWDGYVPDQRAVKRAFEADANNPIVVTGDFHSNWANDITSAEEGNSEPVGAEFVGTSISSGGDGSELDDFNGNEEGVLGRHVIEENENVKYNCNRRGYTRCTLTPETFTTEFQIVDMVTSPGGTPRTDATFTVKAGEPGLQPTQPTLTVYPLHLRPGGSDQTELVARFLPNGLGEGQVEVSIADGEVASIQRLSVATEFSSGNGTTGTDGTTASVEFNDGYGNFESVVGGVDVPLATLDIAAQAEGQTAVTVSVDLLTDDDGTELDTLTRSSTISVTAPNSSN